MQERPKHNLTLTDRFLRIAESGHIVNAYLLCGPYEASFECGLFFANLILKSDKGFNPDLITVSPSAAHILVSDIEELQEKLKFKPFSDRRVVLIEKADLLVTAGQNKLLKTLEEPSAGTTIILLAERRDALLPTVLSRCVEFTVEPIEKAVSDAALECCKVFLTAAVKHGAFYELRNSLKPILDEKNNQRELALEFLDLTESILRDSMMLKSGIDLEKFCSNDSFRNLVSELSKSFDIKRIEEAISLVEETGRNIKLAHSTAYALKNLCLCI